MKRQLIYATTAALIFASCSEPLQEAVEINSNVDNNQNETTIVLSSEEYQLVTQLINTTPKISSEEAQDVALQLFGYNVLDKDNLMMKPFCIKNTIPCGLNKSAKVENDTAFYLFNAPNDNGFAIISADLRVPQQVLAFSDNGTITIDTTNINPITDIFLNLAKEYVAECIEIAEEQKDSLTESVYQKLGIQYDTISHKSIHTKKHHEKILLTSLSQKTVNFRNTAEVKPMLKTEWHQGWPYNIQAPSGYPAGCVTIATAQLMKYWQYPLVLGNKVLLWHIIDGDESDLTDLTYLLKHVSNGIDIKYKTNDDGKKVGRANRHDALKYLKSVNYSVPSQLYDYKYEKVTSSLNNGCPVFMVGNQEKVLGGLWYKNGHAWLVDGYVEQTESINAKLTYIVIDVDDNNNTTTHYEYDTQSSINYYKYLHINWGWEENCNGYFCKDVFNARNRYKENPDGTYGINYAKSTSNYRYNLEIATDIRPKR